MAKGKVCLAYSGGLDTSCILKWLLEDGYEVVCFLANVGQEEDWAAVEKKALTIGATKMVIEDLQKEFVEELCFRAVQCNAQYEGRYLLGTSLARPVIARSLMRVAQREGCDSVSHGATAKGNDQLRFEFAFYAIQPSIKIIAPWRDPKFFNRFQGRNDLLDYAAANNLPVTSTKAKPWSMDANLAHCSYEAGILEDPNQEPPSDMWTMTEDPLKAPNEPTNITISFEKGVPTKVVTPQGTFTDSVQLFKELNRVGKVHGIGRIDIVENRFIGLKSRGCYDSPAMTILRLAHLDLEGLVLDGQVRALRDQFVTHNWSNYLYNGMYFSPERTFVENSLIFSQQNVNGEVRLSCFKGNAYVLGRTSSSEKLYSMEEASMDSLENFSPEDTTGFIKIQTIRLKKYADDWAEQQ
ncbi:argininosuccinate synthase [Cladophialophora psammophila CBS 110553]|uniref:Argininosuccinate synthase n=1 Tax=Cladophialophora psammophila CBS 110553 TaxID=1182543 RepID=W9WR63_9EURO|nr:argininosuccinate synthase [Cladophialophora psammophila CBS 110553]EXJ67475.1 argininosuccinate synthase [Cladophialophora psammophila CBS 110553]